MLRWLLSPYSSRAHLKEWLWSIQDTYQIAWGRIFSNNPYLLESRFSYFCRFFVVLYWWCWSRVFRAEPLYQKSCKIESGWFELKVESFKFLRMNWNRNEMHVWNFQKTLFTLWQWVFKLQSLPDIDWQINHKVSSQRFVKLKCEFFNCLAVMEISAILLKYSSFESGFFIFSWTKKVQN